MLGHSVQGWDAVAQEMRDAQMPWHKHFLFPIVPVTGSMALSRAGLSQAVGWGKKAEQK